MNTSSEQQFYQVREQLNPEFKYIRCKTYYNESTATGDILFYIDNDEIDINDIMTEDDKYGIFTGFAEVNQLNFIDNQGNIFTYCNDLGCHINQTFEYIEPYFISKFRIIVIISNGDKYDTHYYESLKFNGLTANIFEKVENNMTYTYKWNLPMYLFSETGIRYVLSASNLLDSENITLTSSDCLYVADEPILAHNSPSLPYLVVDASTGTFKSQGAINTAVSALEWIEF